MCQNGKHFHGPASFGTRDKIRITVLKDSGTIRLETDQISPANHLSAEQFESAVSSALGGDVSIEPRAREEHHASHEDEGLNTFGGF